MTTPASVLLVNNYHYRRGGADVVYLQQDAMLREHGWRTANLAMHHPRNLESEWSKYWVDEIEFGRDYGLLDKARHALSIIHSRQAYRSARSLIDLIGAKLVHAHSVYHHLSPSVLKAASDAGVPCVLTLHDYKVLCPAYSMLRDGKVCEDCKGGRLHNVVRHRCIKGSLPLSGVVALESITHRVTGAYRRHVDRFISPSRFLIDKCVEWGWPREVFTYMPNCVDISAHQPVTQPGKRLLYVGRLSHEKGLPTMLQAAIRARVGIDIVGSGPIEDSLRETARSNGLDVEFHGHQTGRALWSKIEGARALVLAPEWYENAPISVIEAYATGKPVIVTAIGGLPEMVIDGETGLIVPPFDPEALADAMARMVHMPDDAVQAMGANARHRAESLYSQETQWRNLMELYASLGVGV